MHLFLDTKYCAKNNDSEGGKSDSVWFTFPGHKLTNDLIN